VTITIAAADTLLNPAGIATMLLYLDNKPPIVDLDPPNVREFKRNGTVEYCSNSFDPLGDSPSDLDEVGDGLPFVRALVWDDTNRVVNVTPGYIGTDRDSVYLYLQADPTQPVIVDDTPMDGDNTCNAINPALPATNSIHLTAISQAGDAWFGGSATDASPDPLLPEPPNPHACEYQGGPEPRNLCTDQRSDLKRVTEHDGLGDEPVIYGNGSLDAENCTGSAWQITAFVQGHEGWICLAAVAKDKFRRTAVSRPLRLCYDNPSTPAEPDCSNPPSCTAANCTAPQPFGAVDEDDRIIDLGDR
jgi:hypothetical protein